MPIDPGPHDLDRVRPILGPDGNATLKEASPRFYEELPGEFPTFKGHHLIQKFDFDSPWPTWEMHPEADEFVYLLSGDVSFRVKAPGQPEVRIRVSKPGCYVMVPRGHWHTAEPLQPTSMLFVTAGEGTRNETLPPE
jgi:mannose-6-phosphate isomerase-like protein (cupin superfamily)